MYLIFGGSSGLGAEIVKQLRSEGSKIICLSRKVHSMEFKADSNNMTHEKFDLNNFNERELNNIFERYPRISGICFSQRYRKSTDYKKTNTDEYAVMVKAIGSIIDLYIKYRKQRKDNDYLTRILIIGSTYSKSVGYDQGWEYHTCKASQAALVRFFSNNSNGFFNINMLSPATFMKNDSEEYWRESKKTQIWNSYPVKKLAHLSIVAKEAAAILTRSTIYNSGNNIMLDSGISHLYNDQRA